MAYWQLTHTKMVMKQTGPTEKIKSVMSLEKNYFYCAVKILDEWADMIDVYLKFI